MQEKLIFELVEALGDLAEAVKVARLDDATEEITDAVEQADFLLAKIGVNC